MDTKVILYSVQWTDKRYRTVLDRTISEPICNSTCSVSTLYWCILILAAFLHRDHVCRSGGTEKVAATLEH